MMNGRADARFLPSSVGGDGILGRPLADQSAGCDMLHTGRILDVPRYTNSGRAEPGQEVLHRRVVGGCFQLQVWYLYY